MPLFRNAQINPSSSDVICEVSLSHNSLSCFSGLSMSPTLKLSLAAETTILRMKIGQVKNLRLKIWRDMVKNRIKYIQCTKLGQVIQLKKIF